MNRKKLKIVSLLSALTLLVGASAGVNAGAAPRRRTVSPRRVFPPASSPPAPSPSNPSGSPA